MEPGGALEALSDGYQKAEEAGKFRTGIIVPTSGVPTRAEMAALLFLGTFPESAKTQPTFKHPWRSGLYHNMMTYPRDTSWGGPERRLYAAWFAARREPDGIGIGLRHAAYPTPSGIPFERAPGFSLIPYPSSLRRMLGS